MKKAEIHTLLVEELIDVLHELNDVYNLQREVQCWRSDLVQSFLLKAVRHAVDCAECASQFTANYRTSEIFFRNTFVTLDRSLEYVDKVDLLNALHNLYEHVHNMRIAYESEMDIVIWSKLIAVEVFVENIEFLV